METTHRTDWYTWKYGSDADGRSAAMSDLADYHTDTDEPAPSGYLVETAHEDTPGLFEVLDYGPWVDGAWTGPTAGAAQTFATEAAALDRLAAEVAHPGGDWVAVRVRHADDDAGEQVTVIDLAAHAAATEALERVL